MKKLFVQETIEKIGQEVELFGWVDSKRDHKKIVFIDKDKGLFEPRDIIVGARAGGFYEVKSGLQEGEKVVTSGNFLIDSESRLKAVLEGMGTEGAHQHGQ